MDIIKGLKGLKGSLPVHLVSSFYVFAQQYTMHTFIINRAHKITHSTAKHRSETF